MERNESTKREYVISVDSNEQLYGIDMTDWFFESVDKKDIKFRYVLIGKIGSVVLQVKWVLVVQQVVDGDLSNIILNEGEGTVFNFKNTWKEFKKEFKKHFNIKGALKDQYINLHKMDVEGAERVANSILSCEV